MKTNYLGLGLLGAAVGAAVVLAVDKISDMEADPLETVPFVDLPRYLGDWYDIAHYPAPFQEGCSGAMAHYSLKEDGSIRVVNTCLKDGVRKNVEGCAWVTNPVTNAELKVQFFWPFKGDYHIIELDDEYQWAVVGEPRRRYVWILSRQPELSPYIKDELWERIARHGYNPAKLVWEKHTPAEYQAA